MMEQFDINAEYERIFGTFKYPTLYASQDEEYIKLRRQIVGAVPISYVYSKLPFEDIYNTYDNDYVCNSLNVDIVQQTSYNDHLSCYNVITGIRNYTVNILMGILSSLSKFH